MVMNGSILDWLTIDRIGVIIGILLGVVALFFKWKGWHTAEEVNKIANEAKERGDEALRMTIRSDFASKEMDDTMKRLWAFYKRYGDTLGKEFEKMLNAIDYNVNTEEQREASELDDDRRRYVYFFDRNKRVLKYFPDDLLKDTIYSDEVKLLLLIEPMEKAKAQHTGGIFNKELFDDFRERYKKELGDK